jgi:hypothetical protein
VSALDALLGKIYTNGVEVELSGGLDFKDGLQASLNESTGRVEVTLPVGAVPVVVEPEDEGKIVVATDSGYALVHPHVFYVRDPRFGAVGDGITDDYDAAQAALTAAAACGGIVVFSPVPILENTVYRIETGLVVSSNTTVILDGVTVDFSACAVSSRCFTAAGTEGTPNLLTANATVGAITVAVTSAAGLARGDLVRVYSEAVFDASQTDSTIGEICKIESVSGLNVTLEAPLKDTYNTADTAALTKIDAVRGVRIRGGTLLGGGTPTTAGSDADHYGTYIDLADDCIVDGVTYVRCDRVGAQFKDAVWCKLLHCRFENFVNDTTGYGVSFADACQDCIAAHNSFIGVRHSLSTNSGDHGVPRRIIFAHNHVYASETARAGSGGDAIDTHACSEDIYIYHNVVYGSSLQGIQIECASARVIGNVIWHAASHGIRYHNESDREGVVVIHGNEVRGAGATGITVSAPGNGSTAKVRRVTVTDNHVEDAATVGIYIGDPVAAASIDYLVCSGNHVSRSDSTVASIQIERCNFGVVANNVISEPSEVGSAGIRLDECDGVQVQGNVIHHTTSATGYGVRLETSTNCTVAGNRVTCTTASGLRGLHLSNDSTSCVVYGNNFSGCTTEITRGTGSGHDVESDTTLSTTIAGGVVTINRNTKILTIDTESSAATDDLDTINGGVTGQIITVHSVSGSRDPTLKNGTGNLTLLGRDCLLSVSSESITLRYNGTAWIEVSRAILTFEQSVTIASGAVTVNPDVLILTVDTEAAAATDDLDTISGGWTGRPPLTVRCATGTRVPTVRDGIGNVALGANRTLDSTQDALMLVFRSSTWLEIALGNNG